MITWTAWCRCVRDVTGYCACPLCLAAAAPAIRRARRARRRALLRRIREDRRPTGRILTASDEWLSRFVIIGTLEVT